MSIHFNIKYVVWNWKEGWEKHTVFDLMFQSWVVVVVFPILNIIKLSLKLSDLPKQELRPDADFLHLNLVLFLQERNTS